MTLMTSELLGTFGLLYGRQDRLHRRSAPVLAAPYTDLWRDLETMPRQAVTPYGLFCCTCPNPARGDLFIETMSWQYLLFVFQRRGGSPRFMKLELFAAAPLKNKKDWVVAGTVL
jgi:hypothetical protein